MRQITRIILRCGLCLIILLIASSTASAAVIAGRVVDGDGKPVADAEVRVWQKLPDPMGQTISDQPVRFADGKGGDVLRTDADGRFETPDVVAPDAFARVFVDAEGMLTARGEWLEIRQDKSPQKVQLVMRRLRIVAGRVLDRDGHPIEGVMVFHVGDAPKKIVQQTNRAGKFQLPGVPEGRVFLFAEKPGYRITGMLLTDGREPTMTLAQVDEPIEPLKTLPPLLPHEEEVALVRGDIERALEAAKPGTPEQKMWALRALAEFDPVEALERAEAINFHAKPQRDNLEVFCIIRCTEGRAKLAWDDLRAMIEKAGNHSWIVSHLCQAARRLGQDERP